MDTAALNEQLIHRYRRWLSALRYSDSVQQRYPRVVRQFCDFIGDKSALRSTPWDVRNFLIHQSQAGRGYTHIYDLFSALRHFSEFLGLGGVRGRIPVHRVRMKTMPRNPPRVVSPHTIDRLVAAARLPRDAALLELMYATGCRSSELARLRVEEIDFNSRKIRVCGKNSKLRYVVFGEKAASAVKRYLAGRNSGYLFQSAYLRSGCVTACRADQKWMGIVEIPSKTRFSGTRRVHFCLGSLTEMTRSEAWDLFKKRIRRMHLAEPKPRPVCSGTVCRIVRELARRIGATRITPHTIRHCFATHMLDGGADIREIQELLGHSFLSSTQIYTHVSRKKLVDAFERCHPRGSRYALVQKR